MTTKGVENQIQLGGPPDVIKVETKMKTGPVLQRAALGDIRNKPVIQKTVSEQQKCVPQKKLSKSISLHQKPGLRKSKAVNDKENVIEKTSKPPQQGRLDETMEMDDADIGKIGVDELSLAFSSQMLNVEDIDSEDIGNPQLVSAYVNDIYKYIWELEDKHCVTPNFLEGQKITHKMRAILIDWLVHVHIKFTLLQETLYLTVAIIDRYLMTVKTTPKEKLQLVGITAMFIATKYEEMYMPGIGDFAYITDKTFSEEDICKMEVHMLKTLDFYISYPLPLHFLRRNSKAGRVDAAHHTLAKYLMELTLPDYEFSSCKPSLLAAAALYLAMKLIDNGLIWNDTLNYYSKYSEKEILPIVCKLSALILKSTTSKQQAVRSKYKGQKYMKISDLAVLRPPFSSTLKKFASKKN